MIGSVEQLVLLDWPFGSLTLTIRLRSPSYGIGAKFKKDDKEWPLQLSRF